MPVVADEPDVIVDESEVVTDVPATTSNERVVISLEAEYFDTTSSTNTHEWVANNPPGASNNASMITTPDCGALSSRSVNSPFLGYYAYFKHPVGQWYRWVRG